MPACPGCPALPALPTCPPLQRLRRVRSWRHSLPGDVAAGWREIGILGPDLRGVVPSQYNRVLEKALVERQEGGKHMGVCLPACLPTRLTACLPDCPSPAWRLPGACLPVPGHCRPAPPTTSTCFHTFWPASLCLAGAAVFERELIWIRNVSGEWVPVPATLDNGERQLAALTQISSCPLPP